MADQEQQYVQISDLVGQAIPPEVLEQLRVLGRVKFDTKKTRVSAVSTSATEYVHPDDGDDAAIVSGLLNHVKEMDDLANQMEDMIDDLTKDMNIPVVDDGVADAVRTLDPASDGSHITRDVLDRAVATIDHAPMLVTGSDPVLTAMTGDGKLDGKFLNCDEIGRAIAEAWNTANPKDYSPEDPVIDAGEKFANDFEKSKRNMLIEIVLMLWWNIIWAKFIVDLVIINPLRFMIAIPIDKIVLFFKNKCGIRRFKKKPVDCIKKEGPINKALNKLRKVLLCKIPLKLYDKKRYKPMVQKPIDCTDVDDNCVPENLSGPEIDKDGGMEELGKALTTIFSEDPCVTSEEFTKLLDQLKPEDLGTSPECLEASRKVLGAVIADALTPGGPPDKGNTAVSRILDEQLEQLGG